MRKIAEFTVNHKLLVVIIFACVLLISLVMSLFVNVNYDLTSYLPDDSQTMIAIELIGEEFGYPGTAELMVRDISIPDALELKERILTLEGVKSVTWLDDLADLQKPLSMQDQDVVESYYKDGAARFQLEFWENGYDSKTIDAVAEIRGFVEEAGMSPAMTGDAISAGNLLNATSNEILRVTGIAMIIIIGILLLATTSWIEPLLFLICIGVAVGINMGTDVIFGSVSYITKSCEALIQLAVSMDYSLMLFHRFREERAKCGNAEEAMKTAISKSATAIGASCLTTAAGFAALTFMRYGIGADLGFVLLKGIIISLVSVLFLLPALSLYALKWVDKTSHRQHMPKLAGAEKRILKWRYVLAPILVVIAVPMFLASQNNHFMYGDSGISSQEDSPAAIETRMIEDTFGSRHPSVLLVPAGSPALEAQLADELLDKPYITGVTALSTVADATIPRSFIPDEARERFETENYVRILLDTNLKGESQYNFDCVEDIKATAAKYYPEEFHLAGSASGVADIKEIVEADYPVVNLISIALVMLIILLSFRSVSIPVILTFVIELSIWINMGFPYFTGTPLTFLGYMMVSSIQLGATIDYAILLTDRYMEFRRSLDKKEAIMEALGQSVPSILTSASIFAVVGFSMYIFSQTGAVSEIGLLIGRGAVLSGFMVLVLLPQLLVIFDKAIQKTTLLRGKRS